ncbi:MAG: GDSL-type esterase/lipase family protein [Bacteroidota bacterium]
MNSLAGYFFGMLIVACSVSAQNPVTNQHLSDTMPFLYDFHLQRVIQFEKEPVDPGRIIFIGNSLTQGGNWKKLLNDSTVINRGIGGDNTYGVLKRLNDVVRRKPSKLFILIGINDIAKDIPDDVIIDNYRKIIRQAQLKSADTKIYVQSLLPINTAVKGFPQHYDKTEHIVKVNAKLKKLAYALHCEFVDLFPIFLDAKKRLDARFTHDGLHLNEMGYQHWVDHLKKTKCL